MKMQWKMAGLSAIAVLAIQAVPAHAQAKEGTQELDVYGGELFGDKLTDRPVSATRPELDDDITYGLGVVARINKGAVVTLVRERVEGDTWLPTSIRLSGEGRAMLIRKLRVDHLIEWFNYRRAPQARVE